MAPLAVKVTVCPAHKLKLPETETVGVGLTVTVFTLVFEQVPELPIILYVVVTLGVRARLEEVAPVFQVYVAPPLPVSVAVCPTQMDDGPVMVTDSDAATLTN